MQGVQIQCLGQLRRDSAMLVRAGSGFILTTRLPDSRPVRLRVANVSILTRGAFDTAEVCEGDTQVQLTGSSSTPPRTHSYSDWVCHRRQ